MNINVIKYDSISSTNTEALEQAKRGAIEGLCIVSSQQLAGRGRHGRTWVSEKNSGLYFSIVLHPKIKQKFLSLITLMTSIAVYDALNELYKLKCDIKWSNDLLVNDKKICGILAETTETKNQLAVIVGIGINLNSTNFTEELLETATSIKQETNLSPNIDELLESLIKFFRYYYEILQDIDGTKVIRKEWSIRSSYFEGKEVKAILEDEIIYGKTYGIEENGALRIKLYNGEVKVIQAGDVEKLRKQ